MTLHPGSDRVHPARSTVLLVDDDPAQLDLYSRVIKDSGFRAITARIGSASLSFPDHEHPALVLIDHAFSSELTPRQVLQLLRERFPSTPVLIFSAHPELPEDMRSLVDGFIRKDGPQNLTTVLIGWMQRARSAESGKP